MQNLDEQQLFDKVRTTLEEYQPECSSSNWNKMSTLLDRQSVAVKPPKGNDLFIGFISGVFVTLSFIGVLYFSQGEKISDNQKTSATNVAINNIKVNDQPIILSSNYKNQSTKNERVQIQVASNVADVSTIDISSLPEENFRSNSYNYTKDNRISDNTLGLNHDIAENTLFSREITNKKIDLSAYNKLKPERIIGITINQRPIAIKSEKKENKSRLIKINWDLFKGSFRFQDDMYNRFVGPDRVRLGYLPELTFGSFQDKVGIGQGLGVELEGPVTKKVFVGIGFSVRNYNWVKEERFESLHKIILPDTSYQYVVDSIHQWKGNWRYFEIPISLKLHFMEFGKSKIFLNTYLAAVLMQSESYEYNRIVEVDKYTLKDKPAPFTNNDFLGNIKIGIEYRYFINRRWNFYFEPYYKWSLRGIGKTDFRPRSFGVKFGLIYQFNLH